MGRVRKLPTASPATVLTVFMQVLLKSPEGQEFTIQTLGDLGVAQPKPARALLTFLELLTDGGCLALDVIDARRDPRRFRELLVDRLTKACARIDCNEKDLAGLGVSVFASGELTKRLGSLPPIEGEKNVQTKSNMLRCLRALHFAILNVGDRDKLADELKGHQRKSRRKPAGGPAPQSYLDSPGASRPRPCAARSVGGTGAASQVFGGRPVTESVGLAVDPQGYTAEEIHHEGSFVVDFDRNNRPVYAHVYLDRPADEAQLERLANLLLDKARQSRPFAAH